MKVRKLWPAFALTLATPLSAGDLPPNIVIEWQTEEFKVLPHEYGGREYERYVGTNSSRELLSHPALKNERITSMRISVDGKNVPVEGWMYLDLANPRIESKHVYGDADRISIAFSVGSDAGNGFDVEYRIVRGSDGYRVIQRDLCDSEMKPNYCVRTIVMRWPYE